MLWRSSSCFACLLIILTTYLLTSFSNTTHDRYNVRIHKLSQPLSKFFLCWIITKLFSIAPTVLSAQLGHYMLIESKPVTVCNITTISTTSKSGRRFWRYSSTFPYLFHTETCTEKRIRAREKQFPLGRIPVRSADWRCVETHEAVSLPRSAHSPVWVGLIHPCLEEFRYARSHHARKHEAVICYSYSTVSTSDQRDYFAGLPTHLQLTVLTSLWLAVILYIQFTLAHLPVHLRAPQYGGSLYVCQNHVCHCFVWYSIQCWHLHYRMKAP